MKKSLIALAVAGAFAAPAFAATSNVDVYGVMNIAIQDTNAANYEMQVTDNVSRIGFKGTEDLGGGLKAVWQIETQLGGTGADGVGTTAATGNAVGNRNTFVGLAGGFGTFVIGRHDTPYKLGTASLDIFADTIGDYNGRAINGVTVDVIDGVHDARLSSAVAYISPTWNGFHFAIGAAMGNAAQTANAVAIENNDTMDAVSATGVYANGPLFLSLSFQDVNALGAADTAWKLGASYAFGDTTVGFAYENTKQAANDKAYLINVKHAMGPIVLKAQYGKVDAGATDPSKWDLGVDYNLSKRTAAYFVYSSVDNDAGTDGHGYNIGIKHSF